MSAQRGVCAASDCYGKKAWPCLEDACRGADWLAARETVPPAQPKRWWKR